MDMRAKHQLTCEIPLRAGEWKGADPGFLEMDTVAHCGDSGAGSRVVKRYDAARTPCQRALASPDVTEEVKGALRKRYDGLNPVALKRKIAMLVGKILKV